MKNIFKNIKLVMNNDYSFCTSKNKPSFIQCVKDSIAIAIGKFLLSFKRR